MIRISRLTDYAFLLLEQLASDDAELRNARSLAEATNLPDTTVSKVLKTLTKEGLLDSHQGAQGGYGLARPAGAITVDQVIAAMEGPIAITLCSEGDGACELEETCPVAGNWQMINHAIHRALSGITLSDMAGSMQQPVIHISGIASPDAEPSGGDVGDERPATPQAGRP